MPARLSIFALALAGSALSPAALAAQAPPAPPPPMRIFPAPPPAAPREWNVITWQVSDVTCDKGVRVAPARLVLPDPQPQMVASGSLNGPPTFTISFALDAEGRAFDITSSTEPRYRVQSRELVPALRASRFAVDEPQTDCTISYRQLMESMAEAPIENIARLGTVDPDKVVEAAKLVGLHETILSWPQGYDTPLGDTGFSLSGGQRQRLAIARALYGDPKFVVLDEPNANLDEVGEQALIQAIRHLKDRKATVIVTTHRPRLIGVVDYMLVLNSGRQVGFGPPKDLFESARKQIAASHKPATAENVSSVNR